MLPTTITQATRKNPKRLVIYGKPKVGKTTLLSLLKGCLILDLESGTDHVDALKIKVIGLQPEAGETKPAAAARIEEGKFYLSEVAMEIAKHKAKTGEFPYKWVAIDTTTQLEEWCEDYATKMYMNGVQGKKFNRDNKGELLPKNQWESVLTLPNGSGYLWLRLAFDVWMKVVDGMAEDIILIAHMKDKHIEKEGKEIKAKELDLTGKIASLTASSSDAIGYIYRKKDQTILNFASVDDTCGSRCSHLRGKEIVVMEEGKDGKSTAFWDRIYID